MQGLSLAGDWSQVRLRPVEVLHGRAHKAQGPGASVDLPVVSLEGKQRSNERRWPGSTWTAQEGACLANQLLADALHLVHAVSEAVSSCRKRTGAQGEAQVRSPGRGCSAGNQASNRPTNCRELSHRTEDDSSPPQPLKRASSLCSFTAALKNRHVGPVTQGAATRGRSWTLAAVCLLQTATRVLMAPNV